MSDHRKPLGNAGETIACHYLEENGYMIRDRNFRTRFGEVDIVAQTRDGIVVIVEVKTYNNHGIDPRYAITKKKQQTLWHMATVYMGIKQLMNTQFRFDLITVQGGKVKDHLENIIQN